MKWQKQNDKWTVKLSEADCKEAIADFVRQSFIKEDFHFAREMEFNVEILKSSMESDRLGGQPYAFFDGAFVTEK